MSGGRFKLNVFSSNELVPDMDAAEAVGAGVVDMTMIHLDQYSGTIPAGAVEQIPFLWKSVDEKLPVYFRWGLADVLSEAVYDVYGIRTVGWTIADPGSIIFKDEFKTLSDLKGRVINVDDPMATILKENFDMRITFFEPEQIYTAMATGTLDGTEYGSIVAMTSMSLEEVAHYLMQPDYQIFWCGCYCIDDDTYNTMPEDLRAILIQGIKAHTLDMRTTYMDMTGAALQKFFDAGGHVVNLPEEDIALLSKGGLAALEDIKTKDDYARRAVEIIEESLKKLGRG